MTMFFVCLIVKVPHGSNCYTVALVSRGVRSDQSFVLRGHHIALDTLYEKKDHTSYSGAVFRLQTLFDFVVSPVTGLPGIKNTQYFYWVSVNNLGD